MVGTVGMVGKLEWLEWSESIFDVVLFVKMMYYSEKQPRKKSNY